jgi:hypothetical protein
MAAREEQHLGTLEHLQLVAVREVVLQLLEEQVELDLLLMAAQAVLDLQQLVELQ